MKISLKAARVNANLTQKEAAKLLKINVSTLMSWENRTTSPKIAKIPEICTVYGVTMDDIFFTPQSI